MRLSRAPTSARSAPRAAIGADGTRVFEQRYPRAGTPNAVVELFLFATGAPGAPVKIDLGDDPDIYVARVDWAPDGSRVFVQRQSRDQKRLALLEVDPATGKGTVRLAETSPTWVNLSDDLRILRDGRLLWTSERDGFRHLYLYSATGEARQLTRGQWDVMSLEGFDERKGRAWVITTKDGPLGRQLYAVDLATGALENWTSQPGIDRKSTRLNSSH
mgnify:CR=1 FL=1